MLAGGSWPQMNDPTFPFMMQNQSAMKQQQQQAPFYSYKPNGKVMDGNTNGQQVSTGLDQTLLGPALDTTDMSKNDGAFVDNPLSTNANALYSAGTDQSFDLDFNNNMFNPDTFGNAFSSGAPSGQVTPAADGGWLDMLEGDMFGDAQPVQ